VVAQRGVRRIGPRPLLIAGSALSAGGMFWLSRITEHSSYAGGMLGPDAGPEGWPGPAVRAVVPGHPEQGDPRRRRRGVQPEQRRAAGRRVDRAGGRRHRGLERGGQQPAVCGRHGGEGRRHPPAAQAALLQTRIYHHALATGFSRGYLVSAGILALILIIALFMMRVSREDLSGADPAPEPAGDTSSPRLA
jgi:hypothetical protein